MKVAITTKPCVMELLPHTNQAKRAIYKPPSRPPMLPLLLLTLFLLIMGKPFIEFDDNNHPRLATWRKQKLEKELNDLDGAEQYVLMALENGMYPCFSCVGSDVIYLRKGQVWKYGMTTKGEIGRYRESLREQRLYYFAQFKGTVAECLKEEKRKIYNYALLPENLARSIPLIRPPGNKRDN